MARYKQLTCPEEILQEKDDEEWSMQFRWLLADEVELPVLIECCFAWVLSTARVGTGTRISPVRVEFVQPRAHVKTIERHFGCPVVCGTPRNAIIFRATDANRPFVTRNAELLGILAPQFDEELKQENGDENFIERVRVAIQQRLTGRRPTIEDIADALHIGSRTLQRRLQDDGASFQRVLEEARHQLARHYLNNSVSAVPGRAIYLSSPGRTGNPPQEDQVSSIGKLVGDKSPYHSRHSRTSTLPKTATEASKPGSPGRSRLLSSSRLPLIIGCACRVKRHRKHRAEGSETGPISARCILAQSLIGSERVVPVRKAGWAAAHRHRKTCAPISGQRLVSRRGN